MDIRDLKESILLSNLPTYLNLGKVSIYLSTIKAILEPVVQEQWGEGGKQEER